MPTRTRSDCTVACLYQTDILRGRVQRHEAIHFAQLAAQRIVHSFGEDEVATPPLLCVSRASHTYPFRPILDFQQRCRLDVDADAVVDELRVRRGRNGCSSIIIDEGLDIPVKHRLARDLDVKGRKKALPSPSCWREPAEAPACDPSRACTRRVGRSRAIQGPGDPQTASLPSGCTSPSALESCATTPAPPLDHLSRVESPSPRRFAPDRRHTA